MNAAASLLLLGAATAGAHASGYVNFARQEQQNTGVVWDMPSPEGESPSPALALDSGGARFALWTIENGSSKEYLLDQKLVGPYLPSADVTIRTLDPHAGIPRTRVDQPFTVEIRVDGLLGGLDLPKALSRVLLERYLGAFSNAQVSSDPSNVSSNAPASSAYLTSNGKTILRFEASAITATDPTKAIGEEYFVVRSLSDKGIAGGQIASGRLHVWPVASGTIKGINEGEKFRSQLPTVALQADDLYPSSETHLMLYDGTQVNGVPGTVIMSYPLDREDTFSTTINVTDLDSRVIGNGTYTLALVSDTVYGRELLCDPVSFHVDRSQQSTTPRKSFPVGIEP